MSVKLLAMPPQSLKGTGIIICFENIIINCISNSLQELLCMSVYNGCFRPGKKWDISILDPEKHFPKSPTLGKF
jgi:hypothetical protein